MRRMRRTGGREEEEGEGGGNWAQLVSHAAKVLKSLDASMPLSCQHCHYSFPLKHSLKIMSTELCQHPDTTTFNLFNDISTITSLY